MPVVSKSVTINAPVSKVFEVVTTPDNWVRYVTSLVDVSDRSADLPAQGSTFTWEYKMMGIRFSGKGTVTENRENQNFGLHMEGKFPIKETYVFRDGNDGTTELKVTVDFDLPGEVLKFFANTSLMGKMNELEAKSVLEKIKAICEEG
jgi:uncharacterized membrane protein